MKRRGIFLLSSVLLHSASAGMHAQYTPVSTADACSVRLVSQHPLVTENDQEIYIAPQTFVPNSEGAVLLAGNPNYIFARAADGKGVLIGRDSLFGAVVTAAGTAAPIPPPIDPHLVTGVRALAGTDGSWNVVFAERAPSLHDQPRTSDEQIVALWHGVFNGTRWTSLEKLPVPADLELSAAGISISALTQHGDRLAWAVGGQLPSGVEATVVLERQGQRWRSALVNTRSAILGGLLYGTSGSLLLTVIAGDTALAPGESDQNSLFLWTSDDGQWRRRSRVIHGSYQGAVLSSSLERWGGRPISTTVGESGEAYRLQASMNVMDGAHTTTIDEGIARWYTYASAALSDHTYLWVTLREQSDPSGTKRLRFVRLSSAGSQQVAEAASPVLNSFRIAPGRQDGGILLTGAQEVRNAGIVVSVVAEYQLECRK